MMVHPLVTMTTVVSLRKAPAVRMSDPKRNLNTMMISPKEEMIERDTVEAVVEIGAGRKALKPRISVRRNIRKIGIRIAITREDHPGADPEIGIDTTKIMIEIEDILMIEETAEDEYPLN
jgi:hypothetical protein